MADSVTMVPKRGKRTGKDSVVNDDADATNGNQPAVSAVTKIDAAVVVETTKIAKGRGRKPKASQINDTDSTASSDVGNTVANDNVTSNDPNAAGNGDSDEPTAKKAKPNTDTNGRVKKNTAKNSGDKSVAKQPKTEPDDTEADEKKPKSNMKAVVIKGAAPVDSMCPVQDKYHVYSDDQDVYNVMLNQTNVSQNNNKFYLIQLLESDGGTQYAVWMRWGRVGYDGQNSLENCASLEKAKASFSKKFYDKTVNHWGDRQNFQKRAGKYDMVELDHGKKVEPVKSEIKPTKPKEIASSKLHPAIQELITLICDIRAMELEVREMKYDADRAPLGKLTEAQIKAGYAALKKIEDCVLKSNFGRDLVEACSEFYTRVPHCFGMKTPPLIRDEETIKEKIQLLEALNGIEVAIRMLESPETEITNPIDKNYLKMNCELLPLTRDSSEFEMLSKYLINTHGETHSLYNLELLEAFSCKKELPFNDIGNRKLLWHGSRLTNWYGILTQGLRIAPPEAPVTGYMFGKGVYFADISSKSANYCFTNKNKNVGIMILCEVALGQPRELFEANSNAAKLPSGYHSTKGVGRTEPDPSEYRTLDDGCVVPMGKPLKADISKCSLQYNEYIVYDTKQIKMRYLLKVKFNYLY